MIELNRLIEEINDFVDTLEMFTDEELKKHIEAIEDELYVILDKLPRACMLARPVTSMMYRNRLANDALYSVSLAMVLGMVEEDTISDKANRDFFGKPVADWIAWANAARDELGIWDG